MSFLQFESARTESAIMSEYRDLVNQGRKQFQKELESILPEVKPGKKGNYVMYWDPAINTGLL